MLAHPHDHLFQHVFADPTAIAALLRRALAPATARAVAWETLRLRSGRSTDAELDRREADLVFDARSQRGTELRIVVEHKSEQTRHAVLQVLEYVVRILRDEARGARRPLPSVLPVLVHHDQRRWLQPESLADPQAPELPDGPPLTFAPALLDLARHAEPEIAAWDMPPAARLALLHLQFARWLRPADLLRAPRRWEPLFRAAAAGPGGLAAVQVFATYVLVVTELPAGPLGDAMSRILGPEAGASVMSTADKLIAEGISRGLAQGKIEGKIEGRAEQLLLLLHRRFGPAAESVTARVRSATADDLDRWALRVLDAPSLAQVFDGS
ncbi:MAG: Rpn family recombination-promoting nuclease/putative transposase [Planctomycetota bacterium]